MKYFAGALLWILAWPIVAVGAVLAAVALIVCWPALVVLHFVDEKKEDDWRRFVG